MVANEVDQLRAGNEVQTGQTRHRRVVQCGDSRPQLSLHLRMLPPNMLGTNVITGGIV
jgi:hypothetical protein